jgi:hypothetical protein
MATVLFGHGLQCVGHSFFLPTKNLLSFGVLITKHTVMIKLIQIATALVLFIQTIGYGQTEQAAVTIENDQTTATEKSETPKIDAETAEIFVGTYYLSEADFRLEIVLEENEFYIISPFSKDPLFQKNETTLRELTRGVDLEIMEDTRNALKYTQNGYETTIKRVATSSQD